MIQKKHSDELIEIGRKLGYDFATYGQAPWNPELPGVAEGFSAGKASIKTRKTPDRFVKKHLLLRSSALQRRKAFDEKVSVEFLKKIDHETCPVTLETLTHGELKGTDWSIDRLNNDGAYAEGNIAVLSTRANKAKGDKSFNEVLALAKGNTLDDSLTQKEWWRMATIMFGPCAVDNHKLIAHLPLALVTRIPNMATRPTYFQLQRIVLDFSRRTPDSDSVLRQFNKLFHPDQTAQLKFEAVISKVAKNRKNSDYEYDSLQDDALQTQLHEWLHLIGIPRYTILQEYLKKVLGGQKLDPKLVQSWQLPNKGRLTV